MKIWLSANLEAHSFIDRDFWYSHFEQVQKMLPDAEVWVCIKDEIVRGFIGLSGNYIAGLFVEKEFRFHGIGRKLLTHVKQNHSALMLNVYEKNQQAVRFYQKEGFSIEKIQTDFDSGQQEYLMQWKKTE